MIFATKPSSIPAADKALPGRETPVPVPAKHEVLDAPLRDDFDGYQRAVFGLGCFWGAERLFWNLDGVISTSVGYAGGSTPNPTYEEVCSGGTGHTEAVQVIYDEDEISYDQLLKAFWEAHDPTQGMRQGNDRGSQYRSAIYTYGDEQLDKAEASRDAFQQGLSAAGKGEITTEIKPAPTYFFAESYHQQYLHKNPGGYCGLAGTGVTCPIDYAAA